ncbi:hypothetical protein GIB67_021409 [Kingdonia uniflora]|uniref:Uncharacterized protein n=1 Tax=Kingdonia uniflora TaxID=39325 RepID=A0A7J7MCX4_9MAGN|nr:hypothetical protein GIB67_021409 [Kingdonia uniflora]
MSHIYILFLTSLFYPFRIHLFLSDKFIAVSGVSRGKDSFWGGRHFGVREAVEVVFLLWKTLVGLFVVLLW